MIGRLRRGRPSTDSARQPGPSGPSTPSSGGIDRLVGAGWTLPRSLTSDQPPVGTRLGVDSGSTTALVDGRGAVAPAPGRPSLDWAIGADDRWYVPAIEPGVSQVRLDHAPVVQTTMRVPGGHVTQRVGSLRGPAYPGGDEWLVVEITNDSSLPVALAWLVRPWDADRLLAVPEITVRPQAGSGGAWQVWAGGLAAVLPRRPSRWAAGGPHDPLAQVLAGEASTDWDTVAASDPDGLASMALLVPLPHTATATIVVPVSARDADELPGGSGASPGSLAEVGWPEARPDIDAVVRGWSSLTERGPRIEVPDPVLADAVAGARRSLLLGHRSATEAPEDTKRAAPLSHVITASGGWGQSAASTAGEQMEMLGALAWWGHADAVDRALVDWPAGQQKGGGFGDVAATTAALAALAGHAVASGDPGPAQAWLPELSGAVEWLAREARRAPDPELRLVADGLDAAAVLLALLDQPEAATRLAADAARHRAAAGPQGPLADFDRPSLTAREVAADAVAATRAGGEASAIWAVLRRASATWTWSDSHRWVADDGLVQARLLAAVARLLVDDRADGLALTTWLPPAWYGLGWEVHGAPTRWGRISYAIRWHGNRPAILWDLGDPLEGITGDPVISVPALDLAWSTTERRGEALLNEVEPPFDPDAAPSDDDHDHDDHDHDGHDHDGHGHDDQDHDGHDHGPRTRGVAIAAPPRSVWRPQDPGPDSPEDLPADDGATGDRPTPPDEGTSFT